MERLATLAASHDQALRALYTLSFTLPPALRDQIERTLRKLQFTGRRFQPPAPDAWRALLSPTDAGGYFTLWLVKAPTQPAAADGVLLGFTLALHQGIVECSGVESMEMSQLPPMRQPGDLVVIGEGQERRVTMLETPFDVARWLVQQALAAQWQPTEPAETPGEYRLYNDLIWQFVAPRLPEAFMPFFAEEAVTGLERPNLDALHDAAEPLIRHPAMRVWLGWAANVWVLVGSLQEAVTEEQIHALIGYILREIDTLPQRTQLLEHMAIALRTQALWFAIHGEANHAGQALLLARGLRALPLRQNPLLAGLLRAGYIQRSSSSSS